MSLVYQSYPNVERFPIDTVAQISIRFDFCLRILTSLVLPFLGFRVHFRRCRFHEGWLAMLQEVRFCVTKQELVKTRAHACGIRFLLF